MNMMNINRRKQSRSAAAATVVVVAADIESMSKSHVKLLQTIHNMIQIIRQSTSLQFGFGVNVGNTNNNNGSNYYYYSKTNHQKVVVVAPAAASISRIENTWVVKQHRRMRQQQQQQQSQSQQQHQRQSQRQPIRLTLYKIRHIIHQIIVDYAISLYYNVFLKLCPTTSTDALSSSSSSSLEWEEFVNDLQHSIQTQHQQHPNNNNILTISQFTIWMNKLGTFLSFVLSTILHHHHHLPLLLEEEEGGDDDDDDCVITTTTAPSKSSSSSSISSCILQQSIQFTNERIVYLHSVCPLLHDHSCTDITEQQQQQPITANGGDIRILSEVGNSQDNNKTQVIAHTTTTNTNAATTTLTDSSSEQHIMTKKEEEQQKKQQEVVAMKNMINDIQSTLDAARISLWTFEQSYIDDHDDDDDDNQPLQEIITTSSDNDNSNGNTTSSSLSTNKKKKKLQEEPKVWWWSNFKELIQHSLTTSIPEFEKQFLTSASSKSKDELEGALQQQHESVKQSSSTRGTTECLDHISNNDTIVVGTKNDTISPCGGDVVLEDSYNYPSSTFANKTLVFTGTSGGGTRSKSKSSRLNEQQERRTSTMLLHNGDNNIHFNKGDDDNNDKSSPPPPSSTSALSSSSCNIVTNQMMLLDDLQRRIRTMGMAEEYEVVNTDYKSNDTAVDDDDDDDDGDDDDDDDEDDDGAAETSMGTSAAYNKSSRERSSSSSISRSSCFLGVSGNLLAELSSTISN